MNDEKWIIAESLRDIIYFITKWYHYYSLFIIHLSLFTNKNKIVPEYNSRTTKIDAVPPCFADLWSASKRFNGRTRGCLPIDTPAPRPCSADPDLSHHTNRDSLKGFACVLFSSSLLQIYAPIIQAINPIVNRKIEVYHFDFHTPS